MIGKSLVQEIRFHVCQSSPGSKGLLSFLENNLKTLKLSSKNQCSILVREAHGVEARVFLAYDGGVEKKISFEGLPAHSIKETLQKEISPLFVDKQEDKYMNATEESQPIALKQ